MTTLNKRTFVQLINEDVEWLMLQPRTIERDHIEAILRDCMELYYPEARANLAAIASGEKYRPEEKYKDYLARFETALANKLRMPYEKMTEARWRAAWETYDLAGYQRYTDIRAEYDLVLCEALEDSEDSEDD